MLQSTEKLSTKESSMGYDWIFLQLEIRIDLGGLGVGEVGNKRD